MSSRDRKALVYLAVAMAVAAGVYFWPEAGVETATVGMFQSIPLAEQRLEKLRQKAAALPVHDTNEKKVAAAVANREKALVNADTPAQAQALLLQTVRKVCDAQTPAVEIRSSSFGQPRAANDFYGEVGVTVNFNVRIEQLVNLMAELAAEPELIALDHIVIGQAADKQKILPVQMYITGLVPKRLVPETKKGLVRF